MTTETPTRPLHAPLDEYVRQFEDLKRDTRQLTDGLTDAQLNWTLEPRRWSIAECLEHLNAVARPYAEKLVDGIAETRRRGYTVGKPVRYNFFERLAIRSMEPPSRFRMPAPRMFRPPSPADSREASELDGAHVVAEYFTLKDRLIELLASADGLDVGRLKIPTPESSLIRLRIGATFAFLASHERRHLWQARKVRDDSAFPS